MKIIVVLEFDLQTDQYVQKTNNIIFIHYNYFPLQGDVMISVGIYEARNAY